MYIEYYSIIFLSVSIFGRHMDVNSHTCDTHLQGITGNIYDF